jgi:hypothetical protein
MRQKMKCLSSGRTSGKLPIKMRTVSACGKKRAEGALRHPFCAAVFLLVLCFSGTALQAQQPAVQVDYSVLPPPIAWPTYPQGVTYFKARGTAFHIDDAGLSFAGGGFDGVVRTAFTDVLASSVQMGLAGMNGDTDQILFLPEGATFVHSDISLGEVLLGVNAEAQVYRGERANLILTAGPMITVLAGSVDSTFFPGLSPGILSDSGSTYTYLYGVQGGVVAGAALGKFHIDGFAMLHHQQGKSRISWSLAGDASFHVLSSTTTSYGIELVYLPWDLTLSVVVQERAEAGASRGFKATLYQVAWTF